MIETVRRLIDTHGNLRAPTLILTPDADLYAVGLTPFAAIQVTLALEETFDVEFPARCCALRASPRSIRSSPASTNYALWLHAGSKPPSQTGSKPPSQNCIVVRRTERSN